MKIKEHKIDEIDFKLMTKENIKKQIEEYFSKNQNIKIGEIFENFNITGLEITNKNNLKRLVWLIGYFIIKKENINEINQGEKWGLINILVKIQYQMILHSNPCNIDDIFESLDNQNKNAWEMILNFYETIEKIKNNPEENIINISHVLSTIKI